MRVLVATQSFDRAEKAIYLGLTRLGHQVDLACLPHAKGQASLQEAGIPVHHLTVRHRMDHRGSRSMREMISQLGSDLVYASSNVTLAAALRATRRSAVPVIAYRGTTGHVSRLDPASWLTFLHPRLAKIACVSNAVRSYLLQCGIPEQKLVTLYKGHDPNWYTDSAASDLGALGIPEGARVVSFAGAIRPVKGVSFLLKAMQQLPDSLNIHLLLIGDIRDGQTRRQIHRAGPRCHSLGHREDVLNLIAASDIFVMPSVRREGLPRAVIEAMCLGVPPLVTDVGGMPELVENEKCGCVVPPQNPEALANAITRLIENKDQRETYGRHARERIQTHFHSETTVRQMASLFEETLTDRAGQHPHSRIAH